MTWWPPAACQRSVDRQHLAFTGRAVATTVAFERVVRAAGIPSFGSVRASSGSIRQVEAMATATLEAVRRDFEIWPR